MTDSCIWVSWDVCVSVVHPQRCEVWTGPPGAGMAAQSHRPPQTGTGWALCSVSLHLSLSFYVSVIFPFRSSFSLSVPRSLTHTHTHKHIHTHTLSVCVPCVSVTSGSASLKPPGPTVPVRAVLPEQSVAIGCRAVPLRGESPRPAGKTTAPPLGCL